MKYNNSKNIGKERLLQHYRNNFEIDENLHYYSYRDFLKAERKYLKYMLEGSIHEYTSQSYKNYYLQFDRRDL